MEAAWRLIDACRDASISSLELQSQEERVDAILQQVAAVQPEAIHVHALPHIAKFSLPRSCISLLGRAEASDPAKTCRHMFPKDSCTELRQRCISRCKLDCVSTEL